MVPLEGVKAASRERFAAPLAHETKMKTKWTKLARFIRPLLAGQVLAAFLAKTPAFAAGTIGFVVTNGTPSPDGIGNLFPRFISATGPSLNNAGEAASRAL